MRRYTLVLGAFAAFALLVLAGAMPGLMSPHPPEDAKADLVRIEKESHRLTLLARGRPLKTYRVALGHGGLQAKSMEGDGRTPEGRYSIDKHLERSAFHRALHISYPSKQQIASAKAHHVTPGGAVMIHGLRNGLGWIGAWHRLFDWTNGCIAVTNGEMDEIWRAVPDGTTVEIVP